MPLDLGRLLKIGVFVILAAVLMLLIAVKPVQDHHVLNKKTPGLINPLPQIPADSSVHEHTSPIVSLPTHPLSGHSEAAGRRAKRGSPLQNEWQQLWFCVANNDTLVNQSLTIKNLEKRNESFSFKYMKVPFCQNYSDFGPFVSAENKTCIRMLIQDQNMNSLWIMEHGLEIRGDPLDVTHRDKMPENTVMEKVSNCTKSADNVLQGQHDNSTSHTMWIILGVLVVLVVFLLFKFWEKIKSRVNAAFSSLRRCKMRSFIKTGTTSNTNATASPNERYVSVPLAPIDRGQ